MGFREYDQANLRVPHRGPVGMAFAGAIGDEQDAEAALLRVAMLCRFPQRCPDDALDTLGGWYRIERYPAEGNTSYRARLVAAWLTWERAGSPESIEAQIRAFGVTDVMVYEQPDFHGGPGAGPHCFWVRLGPRFGTLEASPMRLDAHPAGDFVLGRSVLGCANVQRSSLIAIKRIILKWKAVHGYAVELILVRGSSGAVLGMGEVGGIHGELTGPLTLGTFVLGAGDLDIIRIPIGRTLGNTMGTLGTWILAGYEV